MAFGSSLILWCTTQVALVAAKRVPLSSSDIGAMQHDGSLVGTENAVLLGPEHCVENEKSRLSTDVLFYYMFKGEINFAAKNWGADANHRAGSDGTDFLVVGNPTGSFYRRCLKPTELKEKKTCKSIFLPDIDPETHACEGQGKESDFEKGELAALTFTTSKAKILYKDTSLTAKDLGCDAREDVVKCIIMKSKKKVLVDLTPENAGIAAPMHTNVRLVEISEALAKNLKLPQRGGKKPIAVTWINCANATQSAEIKEDGRIVTKWNYIHAAVVKKSGLCEDTKPPAKKYFETKGAPAPADRRAAAEPVANKGTTEPAAHKGAAGGRGIPFTGVTLLIFFVSSVFLA